MSYSLKSEIVESAAENWKQNIFNKVIKLVIDKTVEKEDDINQTCNVCIWWCSNANSFTCGSRKKLPK